MTQTAPLDKFKKKLSVLSVNEIHRGEGRGGPWVMYEVEAFDEAGKRVDQAAGGVPLRSFDGDLPINQLVEYEVQPKDTERHGRTYTLALPREPTWKRLQALEAAVERLQQELEALKNARNVGPQSDPSPAPGDVAPAPTTQTW